VTEREPYEARIARLRAATHDLPPPAGLADRVLGRIDARRGAEAGGLPEAILRSSRRAIALAAIAAAAATWLGARMERSLAGAAAESALADDLGGLTP
jgi:hypothetical protein